MHLKTAFCFCGAWARTAEHNYITNECCEFVDLFWLITSVKCAQKIERWFRTSLSHIWLSYHVNKPAAALYWRVSKKIAINEVVFSIFSTSLILKYSNFWADPIRKFHADTIHISMLKWIYYIIWCGNLSWQFVGTIWQSHCFQRSIELRDQKIRWKGFSLKIVLVFRKTNFHIFKPKTLSPPSNSDPELFLLLSTVLVVLMLSLLLVPKQVCAAVHHQLLFRNRFHCFKFVAPSSKITMMTIELHLVA